MHPTARNKPKGLGHFFVIFFFLRGPAKVTFNYFSLVLLYASFTGFKNTHKNQEVRPCLVFLHAVLSCFFRALQQNRAQSGLLYLLYMEYCALLLTPFFFERLTTLAICQPAGELVL